MKKVSLIIISAILAMSLMACGGEDDGETRAEAPTPDTPVATAAPAGPESDPDPGPVTEPLTERGTELVTEPTTETQTENEGIDLPIDRN